MTNSNEKCKHEGCKNKVYAKGECKYHRYKVYQRAYLKVYYQKNKDKYKAYQRAYYQKNKDKCKAYMKAYYAIHKWRPPKGAYEELRMTNSNEKEKEWIINMLDKTTIQIGNNKPIKAKNLKKSDLDRTLGEIFKKAHG